MGKKIILVVLLLLATYLFPAIVKADTISDSSASMRAFTSVNVDHDRKNYQVKKMAITKVLKDYHSPLADEVDSFMNACILYDIDCYLLPSIAGLESSFGLYIYPGSHNAWGYGGGYMMFKNWSVGMNTVASGLKFNYLNKGLTTLETIGHKYSESPTWAPRVRFFMNKFEKAEEKERLFLAENSVEL